MNTIDNSQRTRRKSRGLERFAHFRDRGLRQLRVAQSSRCSGQRRGDRSEHRGAPNTSSHHGCLLFDLQLGRYRSAHRALCDS